MQKMTAGEMADHEALQDEAVEPGWRSTMLPVASCGNCKYARMEDRLRLGVVVADETYVPPGHQTLRCWRFPPGLVDGGRTVRPVVLDRDWCGEYEEHKGAGE